MGENTINVKSIEQTIYNEFNVTPEMLNSVENSEEQHFDAFINSFSKIRKEAAAIILCYVYPSRRVVWLSLHHRSERVRKKNMRRIMNGLRKEDER